MHTKYFIEVLESLKGRNELPSVQKVFDLLDYYNGQIPYAPSIYEPNKNEHHRIIEIGHMIFTGDSNIVEILNLYKTDEYERYKDFILNFYKLVYNTKRIYDRYYKHFDYKEYYNYGRQLYKLDLIHCILTYNHNLFISKFEYNKKYFRHLETGIKNIEYILDIICNSKNKSLFLLEQGFVNSLVKQSLIELNINKAQNNKNKIKHMMLKVNELDCYNEFKIIIEELNFNKKDKERFICI